MGIHFMTHMIKMIIFDDSYQITHIKLSTKNHFAMERDVMIHNINQLRKKPDNDMLILA